MKAPVDPGSLKVTEGLVDGMARYTAPKPRPQPVTPNRGVGRNDKCPCGSGKKYKRCCLRPGPTEPRPEYTGSPDIVQSDLIEIEGMVMKSEPQIAKVPNE